MLSKTNNCYFIGTLVEVKNKKEGSYSKDGVDYPYISLDIVVKSNVEINGEVVEVTNELRNFTNKFTKSGTVNANYNTLCNIDELLNKRVVVSGATLQGTRFWSAKTNQLVPSTKYNFNIIRPAKADDKDTATFSFSGFVYKPLTERTDADNNVEYYQMSLAQANYKEDGMHVVDFIVDKDNLKAIQVIESKYEQGSTIEIFGICKNIVTNVTKTEETAFGEPITRILPRSDKKLVITQGKEPIIGEGEYTIEDIKRLNAAFIAEGEQIKNKAVNTPSTPATNNASSPAKPMSKKSALAGLI
jgi:hypothetical protein